LFVNYSNRHLFTGKRIEKIKDQRQKSVICLEKQASKMLRLTNEKFSKLDVGTTVNIPIPGVDRARGSPRIYLLLLFHAKITCINYVSQF